MLNKDAINVQQSALQLPSMVSKQKKQGRKPDERIRRTHQRLGSALVQLMAEKPIDDITVQDVLDRASVGRSTFYLHFRDKNDLLLSQLEMFLEQMSSLLTRRQENTHRVVPLTEMLEHIGGPKNKMYRALADSGRLHDFFDLAKGYFARGIEQRLRDSKRPSKVLERELAVRAFALAGSLLALMRWWLDRGAKESPREMDELFHRVVWDGCSAQPASKTSATVNSSSSNPR